VLNDDEPVDLDHARSLADLGVAPTDRRERAAWVRRRFVQVGTVWYATDDDRRRREELEELALELLLRYRDDLPSLSTLKREVANWSFLPSVVESLWRRAFPPSVEERAAATAEWQVLERATTRIAALRRAGDETQAEALRAAAVAFFNKYLDEGEVDAVLRTRSRQVLRKP
jgi:hypothetical protein